MEQKIRKIVVDGEIYLWRFAPGYANGRCHDVFTAWYPANRKAFLRVHFYSLANPYTGGPFRCGLTNLHKPQWAERLIRYAQQNGWNPSERTKQFVVEDGVDYFAELIEPVVRLDDYPEWLATSLYYFRKDYPN